MINLEDEMAAARLASQVPAVNRAGPYLAENGITYGESSRPCFDMSLSSRFGKEKADELRKENFKTCQDLTFAMLGRQFEGHGYVLNAPNGISAVPGLIGIEWRVGDVWPMKQWNKFDALENELRQRGFRLKPSAVTQNRPLMVT